MDQTKANDAINQLAAARGELTKAVSQMDLKLRMILTAQQWQQLQQDNSTAPIVPACAGEAQPDPTSTPTNQQK